MSYLDAPPEPIGTFLDWYDEAVRRGAPFADAMTLATADGNGRPSARTVLFKGVVDGCVSFVSNFDSRKGRELAHNPAAALVFFWPALGRQVRFEGIVTRASEELSERYFRSRDRDSQLGAWASPQSEAIVSRAELEAAVEEARRRFAGRDVERPPNWGMYLLAPEYVELWISGDHRLHDRFAYRRDGDAWRGQRLAP
ncbi:MAG TPA: pyridoxamine 5'-phosphate oxidase [Polyangiaceae bacterium]|nr:pyridoxamine 5'-phosphate oxidase [Polyangiaceae bacterium]